MPAWSYLRRSAMLGCPSSFASGGVLRKIPARPIACAASALCRRCPTSAGTTLVGWRESRGSCRRRCSTRWSTRRKALGVARVGARAGQLLFQTNWAWPWLPGVEGLGFRVWLPGVEATLLFAGEEAAAPSLPFHVTHLVPCLSPAPRPTSSPPSIHLRAHLHAAGCALQVREVWHVSLQGRPLLWPSRWVS